MADVHTSGDGSIIILSGSDNHNDYIDDNCDNNADGLIQTVPPSVHYTVHDPGDIDNKSINKICLSRDSQCPSLPDPDVVDMNNECNNSHISSHIGDQSSTTSQVYNSKQTDIDKGYAWMILAASSASHIVFGFVIHGYAVLYAEVVTYFHVSWADAGWVGSICGASIGIFALCHSVVLDRLGCRLACILGALGMCVGLVLSSLLLGLPYLYITYGLVMGFSAGLMILPSVVVVQRHFVKHLAFANGIQAACVNIGGLICGPLLRFLIDEYSLGGAILLDGGILLQTVVFGALYRPQLGQKLKNTNSKNKNLDEVEQVSQISNHKRETCLRILKELNVEIFKKFQLVLYMIAIFFQSFGLSIFYHHLINYGIYIGISKDDAALLLLVVNTCIMVAAGSFGIIANRPGYDRLLHMSCVNVINGVVIMTTILTSNFQTLAVVIGISGALGGSLFAIETTNLLDFVPVEKVHTAQAVMMTMFGLSTLIAAPFAGWLVDRSGTYVAAMLTSGSLELLAACFYLIIVILRKHQHRQRHTQRHTDV